MDKFLNPKRLCLNGDLLPEIGAPVFSFQNDVSTHPEFSIRANRESSAILSSIAEKCATTEIQLNLGSSRFWI